uniref:Uncharacterized protein n=1 Tax=Anguilla anguilla TaxID=7936 RepID=A0A0E9VF52_ANGAN
MILRFARDVINTLWKHEFDIFFQALDWKIAAHVNQKPYALCIPVPQYMLLAFHGEGVVREEEKTRRCSRTSACTFSVIK